MTDKKRSSKKVQKKILFEQPRNRWIDFLRLDESYTSLILGIIVVIIASVLLVAFVKSRHSGNLQQATSSISTGPTSYLHGVPLTISPTQSSVTITSMATSAPTTLPIPTLTNAPTGQPLHTILPTQQVKGGGTYIVKTGDDLWNIAETIYGSGYNWVDIANENHITNPSTIYSGNVLRLPKVTPKIVTAPEQSGSQPNNNIAQYGPPITTSTYVVQKGDSLWTISERAYKGNGYEWSNIAKINHLSNPDLIYSGNVLKLPR